MNTNLTTRIIPCLDVKDGRVVKGIKFQNIKDSGSPVELARSYEEQGADEIVLLDISATLESRDNSLDIVRAVRAVLSIPLTVGGGVKAAKDVFELLSAGADKVAMNSAAVMTPSLISDVAKRFGRQCTVIAIDAKKESPESNSWKVVIRSGEKDLDLDVVEWAKEAERLGAGEILLTSWDRDGTRSGYDIELLRAVSSAVKIPVIASGGASTPQHLIEALNAGADAVLAASIFHEGEYRCDTLKTILSKSGVKFRQ
jgi:cyclase